MLFHVGLSSTLCYTTVNHLLDPAPLNQQHEQLRVRILLGIEKIRQLRENHEVIRPSSDYTMGTSYQAIAIRSCGATSVMLEEVIEPETITPTPAKVKGKQKEKEVL